MKTRDRSRRRRWTGTPVLCLILSFAPLVRAQSTDLPEHVAAIQTAVVDAIARAERSVVAIARYRKPDASSPRGSAVERGFVPDVPAYFAWQGRAPSAFGCGVLLDRDGHILTNYHLLGNPNENDYQIWYQQRPFQAVQIALADQVRAGDPWTDLAVLKIKIPEDAGESLQPIRFGDTQQLRKGQFVVALGNPYNIAQHGEVSVSWGILSNLSRKNPLTAEGSKQRRTLYDFGGLLQTDAKLNLGTSGGALINLHGEMIGLITALAPLDGYERSTGFAVPVDDTFQRAVQTLQQGRVPEFGFLGLEAADLDLAMRTQGYQGVRVVRTVPGTPAYVAQLRDDDIISRVNGHPIYDHDGLMLQVGKLPVTETVVLTVLRGARSGQPGQVLETSAKLAKKHVSGPQPAFAQVQRPSWRGATIDLATALPQAITRMFPRSLPADALAIVEVEEDSPAWKAGLRPGHLFTFVDDVRVKSPEAFYQYAQQQPGEVHLRMATGTQATVTVSAP